VQRDAPALVLAILVDINLLAATPVSMAAFATAVDSHSITRISSGLGMMYSLPNFMLSTP
jgi:hypothetical protein